MKRPGGPEVVRALEDEGVPFAFGIPGTHNIELYDALAGSERVRPVLVTDERGGAFMADAVWRASGRLGCVNVVPGAGLTHALSGVAEAYLDTVPMLVLACGIRGDTGRAFQLHDVDQRAIAAPVTKAQLRPEAGSEIYGTVRRACRLARRGTPGPVLVEIPAEHYLLRHRPAAPAEEPAGWPELPPPRPSVAHDPEAPGPDPEALTAAAERLASARRPLLYVGLGAAGAADRLVELAERLEAPVSTTFQGKGVFPETHPLWLWPGFGRTAPDFVREIAGECDACLAIGCRFSEVGTGSWSFDPPQPLIHVDVDPAALDRNFEAAVPVVSDARRFVDALLDRLPTGTSADGELRGRIREGHGEVREEQDSGGDGGRVNPSLLCRELQAAFGPSTVFTADSGNGTFLALEALRLEAPGRFLAPVDYSCMGYSVPAAVGAKLARPDAPVVALAGDGAFLMTGLELLTAVREGAAAAVLVLRDRELAQISQFQEVALNRRTASELPDYRLAGLCEGLGVPCLQMGSDDEVRPVLRRLREELAAGGPVVVEVAVDYSRRTWFTEGVVRTTLGRLPLAERARFVGRALWRRVTG